MWRQSLNYNVSISQAIKWTRYCYDGLIRAIFFPCSRLSALLQEYSRHVSEEEGRKFAERQGCLFVEASAKTAVGVEETFVDLVEKVRVVSCLSLTALSDLHEC